MHSAKEIKSEISAGEEFGETPSIEKQKPGISAEEDFKEASPIKKQNHGISSKGDFVEIDFIGKVKGGGIFDTTLKEIAEKEHLDLQPRPLKICIGHAMVVPGFDNALVGKEIGKECSIELLPKDAFGERQPSLVRVMPTKIFHQQKIDPQPGMSFMMDNYLVRISAVSGGRVTADFNNPLAGKIIVYDFTIKRKIESKEEQIRAVMNFFFNKEFPFSIENKENQEVLIIHLDKNKPEEANHALMIEMMKDKFKEMLKFEIEIRPKEASQVESQDEEKLSVDKENKESKKEKDRVTQEGFVKENEEKGHP